MNVWNVLLWILVLLVAPTCAGYAVCGFLRQPRRLAACYLGGTFMEWALLQWVSVPMTLLKAGFTPVVWMFSALFGALCLFGLVSFIKDQRATPHPKPEARGKGWKPEEIFALVALVAGYGYLAWNCARFQHMDMDDARFVVMAVDIENSNRLFLTDYGTGTALSEFMGPLRHDLFSPWAVYTALVARLTATPVTVVAHSALPQSLMLCALSAWLLLSGALFKDRRFEKYGATLLILLLTMYSPNTSATAESFFIRRLWQGKAVVAGIGIPAMYLVLSAQRGGPEGWRPYFAIYIAAFAMCCMSAMGIIMCCMLCGAFGLAYGIQRRSVAVALKTWGGVAICLGYVGVMLVTMT